MSELEDAILERLIHEYTSNSFTRNVAKYAAEAAMTAIEEAAEDSGGDIDYVIWKLKN